MLDLGRRFGAGALVVFFLAGPGLAVRASAGEPTPTSTGDQGSFGIALLDAPADRSSDPRARHEIVDHLHPGDVIKRRVLLINGTPQPQQFEVYASAATIGNGRFQPADGRVANELTSWISLAQEQVDVPQKGTEGQVPVELTLRVPSNASTGERYAVVWAQLSSGAGTGSVGVNMVNRVGIRAYLDVGPGDEPRSDFAIGKITPARDRQGRPSIAIALSNTGGRAVDISGRVKLSAGPGGAPGGQFGTGVATLAPGQADTMTVTFPRDLPNGPWKIELDLASGSIKHQSTGEIEFPGPGKSGKPIALTPKGRAWAMILGPPLAAGLVLSTGLLLFIRRTRRNSMRPQ